jgi:hypothetical protein
MEITKEQVLKLCDKSFYVDEKLREWFPEAFKVELELGKVYKYTGKFMFKFAGKYSTSCDSGSYGFSTTGKWCENLGVDKDDKYTEATTEEWESALIEEAKRRGYKNGNYECLYVSDRTKVTDGKMFFNDGRIWIGVNTQSNMIYENGVWAEIVKTFSKEEAEELLGGKII